MNSIILLNVLFALTIVRRGVCDIKDFIIENEQSVKRSRFNEETTDDADDDDNDVVYDYDQSVYGDQCGSAVGVDDFNIEDLKMFLSNDGQFVANDNSLILENLEELTDKNILMLQKLVQKLSKEPHYAALLNGKDVYEPETCESNSHSDLEFPEIPFAANNHYEFC